MRSILQLLFRRLNLPQMSNALFLKRRTRPNPNPHLLVAQHRNLGMTGLSAHKFSQTQLGSSNGNISLSKNKYPDKKYEPINHDTHAEYSPSHTRATFTKILKEHQPKIIFQKPPQMKSWTNYFNQTKKSSQPPKNKDNINPIKSQSILKDNGKVNSANSMLSNHSMLGTNVNSASCNNLIQGIVKNQPQYRQIQPIPQVSVQKLQSQAISQDKSQLNKLQQNYMQNTQLNYGQSNKQNTLTPKKRPSTLSPVPAPKSNLVGLNNIGNTCYMNSILQCILNLPRFSQHLLELKSNDIPSSSKIAISFIKFLQVMRDSTKKSQNPAELKIAIGSKKPRFSGYSQQDAQEFLTAFLQLLSSDLNRSKNPKYKELTADLTKQSLQEISQQWWDYNKSREDSIVCDFFTGQLLSKVVCSRCRNQSIAFDNTWDYALNFPSNQPVSLHKLIQCFLKEQTISKDYYCSKCKSFEECTRKLDFYRLPKILVLQLKRFSFGKYNKHKINTKVIVQKQLQLSSFLSHCSHDYQINKNPNHTLYQLVGIVHHSGDIDFGHYTAECMNPYSQRWYNYNDTSVQEINMQKFQSNTPYLLFYARKDL